jgi:competence protein ComEA
MKLFAIFFSLLTISTLSFAQPAMPSVPAAPAVPSTSDVSNKAHSAVTGAQAKAKAAIAMVNINTATEEQLSKLPGIGPAKAKAIIANRPYSKAEELTKVKGIKASVLAKIKPYITVN